MLTHNTHYATKKTSEWFVVRYWKDDGIYFITSNRRLSSDLSKAKFFDNYFQAESFCYRDIESGLADVVRPYHFGGSHV